jgi:hypothetical protein
LLVVHGSPSLCVQAEFPEARNRLTHSLSVPVLRGRSRHWWQCQLPLRLAASIGPGVTALGNSPTRSDQQFCFERV